MRIIKNLAGRKFGKLTAVKAVGLGPNNAIVWECRCECGNITEAESIKLLYGQKKSCGCLKSEATIKRNKAASKVFRRG